MIVRTQVSEPPPKNGNPPDRRIKLVREVVRVGSTAKMKLGAITTVCIGKLLPEMREFLPAARVAFPTIPIRVYTDQPDDVLTIAAACRVNQVSVRTLQDTHPPGVSFERIINHAPYWQPLPIWWKLRALQECLDDELAGSEGVMVVDCDVTFRADFEHPFYGDVALSPFYWGRRDVSLPKGGLLQHRDGEFNAGMLISRSKAFAAWWMEAYLSGEGGMYEQGCLGEVPQRFHTDYISPLHNWGKWRWAAPIAATRSYHQHLHEPSRRDDVGALRIAARRTAAEARAKLLKA